MKAPDWSNALLSEHRGHLYSENGRQAFDRMVEVAQRLPGFECAPGWHGDIRDFRYTDPASGERPYAFIVNREDLRFYVRKPGFSRVPGGKPALEARFPVHENPSGEWTVRIANSEEAYRLCCFLFGNTASATQRT